MFLVAVIFYRQRGEAALDRSRCTLQAAGKQEGRLRFADGLVQSMTIYK
jgi:hypothetical protein